jgi:hypothetical protein
MNILAPLFMLLHEGGETSLFLKEHSLSSTLDTLMKFIKLALKGNILA